VWGCHERIEARLVPGLDGTLFVDFPVILRGRVPGEVLGVFSPGEDPLQVEVRMERERPPSFRVEIGDEDLAYILRPYLEEQTERFLLAARERARAILEVFGREESLPLEALFLIFLGGAKGKVHGRGRGDHGPRGALARSGGTSPRLRAPPPEASGPP